MRLPSTKYINPAQGRFGDVNNFPATIAISPDHRYAATLNDGFGSQETNARQSISVLDLNTNKITDFPDERLADDAKQTISLDWPSVRMGSICTLRWRRSTDPTGTKEKDTGNGIAVYGFSDGKVAPERFIKIAPQKVPSGKRVAYGLRRQRKAWRFLIQRG